MNLMVLMKKLDRAMEVVHYIHHVTKIKQVIF